MKYIEDAIDMDNEYAHKYLALVSVCDKDCATHLHHIVPVAYFRDVLGIKECRFSGSPDMDPENLVHLSVGRHMLAHFYLMKCARKCIKAQMINAFQLSYNTTDSSKITEEEVLARMNEIDAEYRMYKDGKRPHKDGAAFSRTKFGTSYVSWKDGEKNGPYISRNSDGMIVKMGYNGINAGGHWQFNMGYKYGKNNPLRCVNFKIGCGPVHFVVCDSGGRLHWGLIDESKYDFETGIHSDRHYWQDPPEYRVNVMVKRIMKLDPVLISMIANIFDILERIDGVWDVAVLKDAYLADPVIKKLRTMDITGTDSLNLTELGVVPQADDEYISLKDAA